MSTIINAIKYFVEKGAVPFYLNYLKFGEKFFENVKISEKNLDRILEETEKSIQQEKWSEEEMAKNMLIRHVREFENSSVKEQKQTIRYFEYILQIIIGNVNGMLEMKNEYEITNNVSQSTADELENYICYNFLMLFCNCGKIGDIK